MIQLDVLKILLEVKWVGETLKVRCACGIQYQNLTNDDILVKFDSKKLLISQIIMLENTCHIAKLPCKFVFFFFLQRPNDEIEIRFQDLIIIKSLT